MVANYLLKALLGWGLLSAYGAVVAKVEREEYSPMEHPATDIPQNPDKFRWIVDDAIGGKKVSTNGAPVVIFREMEPAVVGALTKGTEINLTKVRTYKGVNYWAVTYTNEAGEDRDGWLSGMFILRGSPR
ncbi:MAG: hypothetical protein HRU19_16260 [Pseudobacteriovorax sp.]|nr:hypothetical protein [Pseudobacteriovorax sp.]